LAEQTTYGIAVYWILAAQCLVELSVGNAAAVWQAAEPRLRGADASRHGGWVGNLFMPDLLEALVELGELDRAAMLLGAPRPTPQQATGERCWGLLLAARGDLTAAADRFRQALVYHERLQMPFELARTLLCAGRIQRRRKLRKEARELLSQALEIFEQLGTPLWADKTRAELDRTHLRQAPRALTPSEQRVAELAGSGLTNRQIAERLSLSPKTVEANIARAYSKLGISSRAELGARMAAGHMNT
jgi:DNA-binding CsgD family transcriptional regulator